MPLFDYDSGLVDDLAARFDLRTPNVRGLQKVIMEIAVQDKPEQVVLDMATGVGKTYLLAALLEYAAANSVRNLLVVLPGKTVRTKTINNFTPGADGFITGAEIPKRVITPDNFTDSADALRDPNTAKLFLLNVHHLVQQDTNVLVTPGGQASKTLRAARPQETLGGSLLEYLTNADDLLMVLDESHLYSETAKTWQPALDRLKPAARVGLTATPTPGDNIIFRYSLRDAIEDEYVKQPVVALRRGGYRDNEEVGQLRDAKALLNKKAAEYRAFELENPNESRINPIMLVSCRDIEHAEEVAATLRRPDLLGAEDAVLVVHSDGMTAEAEASLAGVQQPGSPVRAVVQVDMLNEGWNVHNVAVLVPLRALASGTLTEQMIGRGLRLPYGKYTSNEWIDTLDILSHKSVNEALKQHGIGGRRQVTDPAPHTPSDEQASTDGDTPSTPDRSAGDPRNPDTGSSSRDDTDSPQMVDLSSTGTHLFDLDGVGDGDPDDASVDGIVSDLGGKMRDLGDGVAEQPEPLPPVRIERTNQTDFLFPASTIELQAQRLRFSDLSTEWVKSVAGEIGDATTAAIYRSAIVITDDGGRVELQAQTQVDAYDEPMSEAAVEDHLRRNLWGTSALMNGQEGLENRKRAGALARRLIEAAGGKWTPKRAEAAARKLVDAARAEAQRVALESTTVPKVHGIRLPKRQYIELEGGTQIVSQEQATAANFSVDQYYNHWNRSMFEATRFDAFATELRIARLLDTSEAIKWWTTLDRTHKDVKIEYASGRSYHPDFVALDSDGVHWIIEGKADRGKDDQIVQAKRAAAVRVLREMEGLDEWQDTPWGYLIAYQQDVAKAETWNDLRNWSSPEKMA